MGKRVFLSLLYREIIQFSPNLVNIVTFELVKQDLHIKCADLRPKNSVSRTAQRLPNENPL